MLLPRITMWILLKRIINWNDAEEYSSDYALFKKKKNLNMLTSFTNHNAANMAGRLEECITVYQA